MQKKKNKTSTFSSRSLEILRANRTRLHALANRAMIVSIALMVVAYIAGINDLSIKGFVLQEKKMLISELEKENERNELMAMELESFDHINTKAKNMGLVKVDKIEYYSVVNGVVAKK